jgi:hypothetical protein
MSDPTYDPQLARLMCASTDAAVRPYHARRIAEQAIADAMRTRRPGFLRTWRAHGRPRLLPVAALLVGTGAALAAGASLAPRPGDARGVIVTVSEPTDGSAASAWRTDLATGRTETIVAGARFVSLAPDASHLAVLDDTGIRSIDTRTGVSVALDPDGAGYTQGPGGDRHIHLTRDLDPFAWSLDGTRVSFLRCVNEGCTGRVVAADGSSSGWLPLAGPEPAQAMPYWWWRPEDGKLVAYRDKLPHWFLANPDGSDVRQVSAGEAVFPTDDPGAYLDQEGTDAIFAMGVTRVTFGDATIGVFAEGADRSWIVFDQRPVAGSDPVDEAWLVAPDGSKQLLDLAPSPSLVREPDAPSGLIWERSRERVLVPGMADAADPDARTRYVVDTRMTGQDAAAIPSIGAARMAAWSPSSDWLVVESGGERRRLEIVRPDLSDRRDEGGAPPGLTGIGWADHVAAP